MIGEAVAGFQVTGVLAQGAAGDLFAARGADGAAVLLRVYPADLCGDAASVQRCLADAQSAGSVGAVGIARTVASGMHGDRAYVAFEAGDGEVTTLEAHVRAAGRLSATQVATLARQLADALAAAHARGLVHRDLRPSRIAFAVEPGGRETVRVLDFGSARLEPTPKTVDGALYAAPERWTSPQQVDPRADAYALGCVAYDMACGKPPFAGAAIDELRARHLSEPAPAARSVMPDIPPGLEHFLQKLMQKAPAERPKTLAEVARTFEVLGGGALDAAPLAPTGSFEALNAAVLMGTTAPEPASPPELYDRTGEIGEARQMPSIPPGSSGSGSVKISGSLAGHVIPSGLEPPPSPGQTLSTRAMTGGLSTRTILVIGALVAVALVVAILALL